MTQLNQNTRRPRQALEDISRKYPGLWKKIDAARALRAKKLKPWPEVCFIPASIINDIFYQNDLLYCVPTAENDTSFEIARLSALAAWRVTQGIYRFDDDIYEAVRNTPIEGDFPWKVLCHIPEWCIYIETPNFSFMNEKIYGVWMHIDWQNDSEFGTLCMVFDSNLPFPLLLHLNEKPIHEQYAHILKASLTKNSVDKQKSADFYVAMVGFLTSVVSLGIFICTQAAEVGSGVVRPAKPMPQRIKRGEFRLFPPSRAATWEVGVRMGAALRQARQRTAASEGGEDGSQNAPRAHIRRAHWHKAVTGPRKLEDGTVVPTSQRKLKVRWQPPLAINVKDLGALPATVRAVGSRAGTVLPKSPGALASRLASAALAPAAEARRV